MRIVKTIVAFVAIGLAVSTAYGQSFTVTGGGNNATFDALFAPVSAAAEGSDALLTGGVSFDFTTTTGSDILLFDAEIENTLGMNVPGGWYNAPANNSDIAEQPGFFGFVPSLEADAFITTPGTTGSAGANTLNGAAGMRLVTHSDSTDEGAQTDFTFGRITLIPDANGEASLTLRGTLQTSSSPTPIFDDFQYDITLASVSTSVLFEDGVSSLSGGANSVDGFFSANATNASILAANDAAQYPNGVTLFVPRDAVAAGASFDVDNLLVETLASQDTDGTPGLSAAELTALVANVGDTDVLTTFGGRPFELRNGSLFYGDAEVIVADALATDNGWIHVLDAVPVPEPSSVTLLMSALIGLGLLRRRS